MEIIAIRSELIDDTFRIFCRGKLEKECIKKRLPCSVYLYPFDEVLSGKEITDGLAKGLYKRIMELKKEYELSKL